MSKALYLEMARV